MSVNRKSSFGGTWGQVLKDEREIDLFFTLKDEEVDSWFKRDRMAWEIIKEMIRNYPWMIRVQLEVGCGAVWGVRKWIFTFCGKYSYDVLDSRTAFARVLEDGAAFDDETKAVIMDLSERLRLV